MKNIKLICTKCCKVFSTDSILYRCDVCNEPLEVEMITKGKICEGNILNQTVYERYADFFPLLEMNKKVSLGEGFTPLIQSRKLAKEIGIGNLFLKNESVNPTWSFKDRGTATAILHAIKLGFNKIGTVSTGNMAVSVAAYGSKTNLETFILVNKNIPIEKLSPVVIYNPHLIKVDGDYGKLYFESLKVGREQDICFINSDAPFRVEGYKTLAFEICEQTNFKVPDYVVVPTSAGGHFRGIEKGFQEFKKCGLIEKVPKMICAQASGCAPIYNAYVKGEDEIERIANPNTIAHAIKNPYPPSGNQVLRTVKANKGICVAVDEEMIINSQRQLAKIGLFVQPASAVTLAAVKKMKDEGYLSGRESIACVLTGSGLKYTSAFKAHDLKSFECKLDNLNQFIASKF